MSKSSRIAAVAMLAAAAGQFASPFQAKADEPTTFAVAIRNVATSTTLSLPNGMTSAAPIAPGIYAVTENGARLFEPGHPAVGSDLEGLAEDGDAQALLDAIKKSRSPQPMRTLLSLRNE